MRTSLRLLATALVVVIVSLGSLPVGAQVPSGSIQPGKNDTPAGSVQSSTPTPTPGRTIASQAVSVQGGGLYCPNKTEADAALGGNQSPGGEICVWDDYTGQTVMRHCPEGWLCIWEEKGSQVYFLVLYVGTGSGSGSLTREARNSGSRFIAGYPDGDKVHENPPCQLLREERVNRGANVLAGNFTCAEETNTPTPTPTPTGTISPTATSTSTATSTATATPTMGPNQSGMTAAECAASPNMAGSPNDWHAPNGTNPWGQTAPVMWFFQPQQDKSITAPGKGYLYIWGTAKRKQVPVGTQVKTVYAEFFCYNPLPAGDTEPWSTPTPTPTVTPTQASWTQEMVILRNTLKAKCGSSCTDGNFTLWPSGGVRFQSSNSRNFADMPAGILMRNPSNGGQTYYGPFTFNGVTDAVFNWTPRCQSNVTRYHINVEHNVGPNKLRVTISTGESSVDADSPFVGALRFSRLDNVKVHINGQTVTQPKQVETAWPEQYGQHSTNSVVFVLERTSGSGAGTAALKILGTCDWETFVGAGPNGW